jgi:hypothetical protein
MQLGLSTVRLAFCPSLQYCVAWSPHALAKLPVNASPRAMARFYLRQTFSELHPCMSAGGIFMLCAPSDPAC